MSQQLINRIPEKYRFLSFLVVTSMIGVALILLAVYNASRELELIHALDNLHGFASAQLDSGRADATDHQRLLALAAPGYRVFIAHGERIIADSARSGGDTEALTPAMLEKSRVNAHGGYIDRDDDSSLVWTGVRLPYNRGQLFVLQDFTGGRVESMLQVYSQRLLIPAGFYIWLMVWMGFILRFLTDKLSRQKKEMEHMALHDALTGLPNRNLLNDRLDTLVAMSKRHHGRFALAMIDLDGFKNINDSLGHDAGDALLKAIAWRLGDCIRSVDTVARVGGDEFVLLLDDLDRQGSRDILERIAAEIMRPVSIRNAEVEVGCSIGIAVFPEHGEDAETLTRNADQAMYAVKGEGGGIRFIEPEAVVEPPPPRAVTV